MSRVLTRVQYPRSVNKLVATRISLMSGTEPPSESTGITRRLSQSAPALLALDRLISVTGTLDKRVSALGLSVRASRSSSFLSSNMSEPTSTKQRTCHACHAPLSLHSNIPSGLARCPLPHWDECPGGYTDGKASNGKEWRGCPTEFSQASRTSPAPSSEGSGSQRDDFEDSLSHVDLTEKNEDDVFSGSAEAIHKSVTGYNKHFKENKVENDATVVAEDPDSPERKQLEELQARNAMLKEQFAKHAALKAEQEKQERVSAMKLMKAENQRLIDQMAGDIGGAKQRQPQSSKAAPGTKLGSQSAPRSGSAPRKQPGSSVSWHQSYQQHLTKNQIKASQAPSTEPVLYTGLDMNGIRKISHLRDGVEQLVEQVQDIVPSLDRRPTAVTGGISNQFIPKPVFANNDVRNKIVTEAARESPVGGDDYIYLRRGDGTIYKVQVMNEDRVVDLSPKARAHILGQNEHSQHRSKLQTQYEDPLVSSDDECPITPKPGWKHVWRLSADGEKYFTEEPIILPLPKVAEFQWIKDSRTGRTTKKLVESVKEKPELELRVVVDPNTGREVQMLVPKTPTMKSTKTGPPKARAARAVDNRVNTNQPTSVPHYERAPSYIAPTEDR